MARKFSKQSEKLFRNTAKNYNRMRTMAQNKWDLSYLPDKILPDDVLKNTYTTEQLRNFTKQIADFKHLTDFLQAVDVPFNATQGEVKTFKREQANKKRMKSIQAKKLRQEFVTAPVVEIEKLRSKLAMLETPEIPLKQIRTKREFSAVIKSSVRYKTKLDVQSLQMSQYRYIGSLKQYQEATGIDLSKIINKILNMKPKQYQEFFEGGGNEVTSLYFKNRQSFETDFNTDLGVIARLNNMLGNPQSDLDLQISESEFEVEDME